MNQTRGVFDQSPSKPAPQQKPATDLQSDKGEFRDVFQQNADAALDRQEKSKINLEDAIKVPTAAASSMASQNVQADLDDMAKISSEDLDLAEMLIFKGYAETDVRMDAFPKFSFTIASTNAEEWNVINEIVFDYVKSTEDAKSGAINIPQSSVDSFRNALFIAMSYKGMNKKELCDDSLKHLNTIKRGITSISKLELAGKIVDAAALKAEVKSSLKARAQAIMQLPTPIIDYLGDKKREFDTKMYDIMNQKNILPKS